MDNKPWSMEVVTIHGPEDLRETTRGSDVEIVQLKSERLRGSIAHFGIRNTGIALGRFNSEIRMRGTLHRENVVLGTILNSAGRVTQWWTDVQLGDVGIFPAGVEFDAIHGGGADYLVASIPLAELSSMFGGDERLADPAFWNTKRLCRADPLAAGEMLRRLMSIMSGLRRGFTAASARAADFLERSIVEAFMVVLMSALPPENGRSCYTGARLVSEAEDYVNAAAGRPVHISELCGVLKASRRTLHRAFADALGMGPVAYLRSRRLSAVRSVLRRSDPRTISIGDVAFEHGFPETGRFAAYYRAHFGETPSETCRVKSLGIRNGGSVVLQI
jgi:AraC family ethanolamine operon transcriptional activator